MRERTRAPGQTSDKTLLTFAEQEGDVVHLSTTQVFSLTTAKMVDPSTLTTVWLPEWPGLQVPRADWFHITRTPISLKPLRKFFRQAAEVLGDNFGAAVLAWGYMFVLHRYRWILDTLRHFNLPVLYGPPTAGKTLVANCAAWMNGCTELQIASRYYTRLCVFKMDCSKGERKPGASRKLEGMARDASAALPVVLREMHKIEGEDLHDETERVLYHMPGDIRVSKGVAHAVTAAQRLLDIAKCDDLCRPVEKYVDEVLLPYHRQNLQGKGSLQDTLASLEDLSPEQIRQDVCIDDSIKHVKSTFSRVCSLTTDCHTKIAATGGRINVAGRMQGKVVKVAQIPRFLFAEKKTLMLWKVPLLSGRKGRCRTVTVRGGEMRNPDPCTQGLDSRIPHEPRKPREKKYVKQKTP